MYKVELYGRVRRAVRVEGKSERAVALEFGLARETVRKMLRYAVPPGYRRQQSPKRPKLGPWLGVIDAILEDDKQQPKKQRHTAKRIFERLRSEHAYTGGYTIVKDYVRQYTLRHQEMFVPLTHAAGQAQADFGEALVVVGGVEQKAHYLAMDLPHSDDCFVMAFPAETTEAFWRGMFRPPPISAAFPPVFCTTTRNWQWRRFWATAAGRRRGRFPSYKVTIYLPRSSGGPGRGMTRER
jgi:transposase